MTPERWREVERVYLDALSRDRRERDMFLADIGAADASLRHDVDALLAQETAVDEFLAVPALDVAGQHLAASSHAIAEGHRIGDYVIQCQIGAGGMGEVYRARGTTRSDATSRSRFFRDSW